MGKKVQLEKTTYGLQDVVAKQVMQMITEAEIINSGEVPKLKKNMVTLHIFKELCTAALQGSKYKAVLENKFSSVWGEVASAEKVFIMWIRVLLGNYVFRRTLWHHPVYLFH